MVDLIFDFIRNTLMGNTTMNGADNLAILLTWTTIVMAFCLFVRVVMWAFYLVKNSLRVRRK